MSFLIVFDNTSSISALSRYVLDVSSFFISISDDSVIGVDVFDVLSFTVLDKLLASASDHLVFDDSFSFIAVSGVSVSDVDVFDVYFLTVSDRTSTSASGRHVFDVSFAKKIRSNDHLLFTFFSLESLIQELTPLRSQGHADTTAPPARTYLEHGRAPPGC